MSDKNTVVQEFQSGSIGWEVLFIFIAGLLGDIFIHGVGELTTGTSYPIAQGLLEYYKSLGEKFFVFPTPDWSPRSKMFSSTLQGAIWGGIACVFALLIAKLFLFAKEELGKQNFEKSIDS